MDKKLLIQAISKYFWGLMLVSILLFIPAGTLNYWNAWLLIGVLFVPMFIVGTILALTTPELLRKRLNSKEKETEQKSVVLFGGLMFIIGFVIAGLDYRFQWLVLPNGLWYRRLLCFYLPIFFMRRYCVKIHIYRGQ